MPGWVGLFRQKCKPGKVQTRQSANPAILFLIVFLKGIWEQAVTACSCVFLNNIERRDNIPLITIYGKTNGAYWYYHGE